MQPSPAACPLIHAKHGLVWNISEQNSRSKQSASHDAASLDTSGAAPHECGGSRCAKCSSYTRTSLAGRWVVIWYFSQAWRFSCEHSKDQNRTTRMQRPSGAAASMASTALLRMGCLHIVLLSYTPVCHRRLMLMGCEASVGAYKARQHLCVQSKCPMRLETAAVHCSAKQGKEAPTGREQCCEAEDL